jgi:hypothetical protein
MGGKNSQKYFLSLSCFMVQIVPGQRLFRISGSVMKVDALNPKTYTVSAAAGADSKGLPETVQGQLRIPQTGA